MVLTRSKKTAQESSDEAHGTRGGAVGWDVVDPDIGHGNVEQQEDSTEDDNDYYSGHCSIIDHGKAPDKVVSQEEAVEAEVTLDSDEEIVLCGGQVAGSEIGDIVVGADTGVGGGVWDLARHQADCGQ